MNHFFLSSPLCAILNLTPARQNFDASVKHLTCPACVKTMVLVLCLQNVVWEPEGCSKAVWLANMGTCNETEYRERRALVRDMKHLLSAMMDMTLDVSSAHARRLRACVRECVRVCGCV